ncbi:DUF1410 domain-containing protein [Ureaplasma urealyticum]|uniref:DUF1410 domain-containing protein n=1 Tax=Ureaplasma urealyticum TaxID=2130 RepID=UPI000302BB43|nr:DUF1410 domain-containing protein [Ureaplasma urealyticum]
MKLNNKKILLKLMFLPLTLVPIISIIASCNSNKTKKQTQQPIPKQPLEPSQPKFTPNPKKDEVVLDRVSFTKDKKKPNEAVVSLIFSKLELADVGKKLFSLEITKKDNTNPIKVNDLNYDEASKTLTSKLNNLAKGEYSISKLTLNGNEISLNDIVKNNKLLIEDQENSGNGGNEQKIQPSKPNLPKKEDAITFTDNSIHFSQMTSTEIELKIGINKLSYADENNKNFELELINLTTQEVFKPKNYKLNGNSYTATFSDEQLLTPGSYWIKSFKLNNKNYEIDYSKYKRLLNDSSTSLEVPSIFDAKVDNVVLKSLEDYKTTFEINFSSIEVLYNKNEDSSSTEITLNLISKSRPSKRIFGSTTFDPKNKKASVKINPSFFDLENNEKFNINSITINGEQLNLSEKIKNLEFTLNKTANNLIS